MATRFVKTANSELGRAYNPAQAGIQAQQPGIQDLYAGLLASLQQAPAAGVQTVIDSAARRGVSRATLAADTGTTLGQEAQLGTAQLGVSRAADIAALQGSLTDLNTGRATAATTYGGQKQQGDINTQSAKLQRKISIEDQRLAIQKLNRQAEMSKKAKAYAEAKAAQAAASSGGGGGYGGGSGSYGGGFGAPGSKEEKARMTALGAQLTGLLDTVRGGDGKVSPQDYKQGLAIWTANGGDPGLYHAKFNWAVNLGHPQDYYDSRGAAIAPKAPAKKKSAPAPKKSAPKPSGSLYAGLSLGALSGIKR